MSGHSKWSTIKRHKGTVDANRGKIFSRLSRDITVATREHGDDISANSTLRAAVDKAKAENMPKANIERAIAKGAGKLPGVLVVETVYEGYGPGGIAFMVKCLTDNKNRTVSEVRSAFSKAGGSLGEAGSVAYIFSGIEMVPSFTIPLSESDAGQFEALYEELESLDDVVDIFTNVENR